MQEEIPQLVEAPSYERAAAIIMVRYIDSVPHILVAKRKGSDSYTLPGGTCGAHERSELCAIRELREETGLEVEIEYLIDSHPRPFIVRSDKGTFLVYCFFCYWDESTGELEAGNMESNKQGEWEWFSLKKAIDLASEEKLPMEIFQGWWMEAVYEEQRILKQPERDRIPAYSLRLDVYIYPTLAEKVQG